MPLRRKPGRLENWGAPEIVEVQAAPGPAVWHLTRGKSEVWILGTVGGMPDGLAWNKNYLAELLDGARAILLPPRPSVGVFEGAWFLLTNGSKFSLPRGQALEPSLSPELRARFVATREHLGQTENRYKTDTPLRAALRLFQDLQDKLDLTRDEPRDTIASLARAKHVPSAPIARYEVLDAAEDVLKLNPEQQRVCLAQSVEDVDRQLVHAVPAAQAWAIGDIRNVKANYAESRLADCVIAAVHSVAGHQRAQRRGLYRRHQRGPGQAGQDHRGDRYRALAAAGWRAGTAAGPQSRHRRPGGIGDARGRLRLRHEGRGVGGEAGALTVFTRQAIANQ